MAARTNGTTTFSHDIRAETAEAFRAFCESEGCIMRRALERTLHLFMALTAEQRQFVMRGTEDDYRLWLREIAAPAVPDHPERELEAAATRAEREQASRRATHRKG
jgi:hypothetical protein